MCVVGGAGWQLVTKSCDGLPAAAACYLERLGNLSGVRVGCAAAAAAVLAGGGAALDSRVYLGHFDRRAPGRAREEFAAAYDLRDSDYGGLRAAVLYNDTTGFAGFTAASFTAVPALLRVTAPVDALLRAFLNARASAGAGGGGAAAGEVVAGMAGLVEMPRTAGFLSLDLGCGKGGRAGGGRRGGGKGRKGRRGGLEERWKGKSRACQRRRAWGRGQAAF